MFSTLQLMAFARELRDRRVLTVYIDGSSTDPATQRAWRLQVDHALKDLRLWLRDSTHDEREELDACVEQLETELTALTPGIGAPGAVSFVSGGTAPETHVLPVPTPTIAVWSRGPCLSPYVRVLKQARPA